MNTLLMEGLPGSGKTRYLNVLVVMLRRLGCKVVLVSQ